MGWENVSDADREYPIKIIEKVMAAFSITSNGLAELSLQQITKPLFRKYSGLNNFFQYRLYLYSEHVEGYRFELFTFGYDADLEKIEVIVDEAIYKEISDKPLTGKPRLVLINDRNFIDFLEDVFKCKRFTSTVSGLMKIAEKYHFSNIEKSEKTELLKKIKDLAAQVEVKNARISELEKQMEYYKDLLYNKPKYSEYNPDLGGIEKVIYILKANTKIMPSYEIESVLIELEPNLQQEWEDTRSNTARYISRAVKAGRVIKHYIGNRFAYALPEWLDDDGSLMRKYNIA